MTPHAWTILGFYLLLLLLAAKPLGSYIANVMEGRPILALRLGGGLEAALYRLCGVKRDEEMGWLRYALAILLFNLLGALAVYALQRLQVWLPLNPQQLANVSPDSAFNTAISFATNTNWQGYAGDSTMGHLTQLLGLAVQNTLVQMLERETGIPSMTVARFLKRHAGLLGGGGKRQRWLHGKDFLDKRTIDPMRTSRPSPPRQVRCGRTQGQAPDCFP